MPRHPPIYILCTCKTPELIDAATLTFRTLRVGFPFSTVTVWLNNVHPEARDKILEATESVSAEVRDFTTIHHDWINVLLAEEDSPFWLCDTDVVFWNRCDEWDTTGLYLSGRLVPRFYDRFTRCVTEPRLHTSLLYMDPATIRRLRREWHNSSVNSQFNPRVNLVNPLVIPRNTFYDTCAFLYHAISGTPFNQIQLASYDHLHAATWVDQLEPYYPGLRACHQAVYENTAKARGLHVLQDQFYASAKP